MEVAQFRKALSVATNPCYSWSFLYGVAICFAVIQCDAAINLHVTSVGKSNSPSSGAASLVLLGKGGISVSDGSFRVRVGETACGATLWMSDTACRCRRTNSGQGGRLNVALTVASSYGVGTLSRSLSYDTSIVNSVSESTGAGTGSERVVIFVRGAGVSDASSRVRIDLSGCEAVQWRSLSSIMSKTASGIDSRMKKMGVPVFVSFASQIGSHSSAWSYCTCAAMDLRVSSIATTGDTRVHVTGKGIAGEGHSARSRFSKTAFSSTVWCSDSGLSMRSSAGFFDISAFPLVVTAYFPAKLHSSALSYMSPTARGVTSVLLGAVSITGANFGTNPAVVSREVFCSRQVLGPMQAFDVCVHDELSKFRDSPVPISFAAVRISFSDVVRLDDVVISLVSPNGHGFVLMSHSCFGCQKDCGESRDSVFEFRSPPVLGSSRVPSFLCLKSGDYAARDDPELQQELASSNSMGRWAVRVSSGSLSLNISEVSMKFVTSSIKIQIGTSPVSSLLWIADSSVVAVTPGYQALPQPSAAGWGRNLSVSASHASDQTSTFSYPNPGVMHVKNRELGFSSTGSTLVSVSGVYFANIDPSVRLRLFLTSCIRTSWTSDTSLRCHTPKVALRSQALQVSIQSSTVAVHYLNLSDAEFSHSPITEAFSNTAIMPMTGGAVAKVIGGAFGVWDSSFRARIKLVNSASSVTKWLQDSVIVLSYKTNIGFGANHTIALSLDASYRTFDFKRHASIALELIRTLPRSFVSTGSQVAALIGSSFWLYSSSASVKVLQTAAQNSLWISDSSTICKSSSGVASISGGIVISISSSTAPTPPQLSFFSPRITSINASRAANDSATMLEVLSLNSGTIGPSFNLSFLGTMCTSTVWTSDSQLKCMNSWQLSKDYIELETFAEFDQHHSAFAGYVANPDFIAAPSPISQSFVPAAFVWMPKETLDSIQRYARFGLNFGPPDFLTLPQTPSTFQYAEIVDLYAVFVCNYTQVYLKDYRPINVDIQVSFSLMDRVDGSSLRHMQCSGDESIMSTLPANLYASMATTSMTFCPNATIFSAVVQIIAAVRNETGSWVDFVTQTPPFSIVPPSFSFLALLNSSMLTSELVVRRLSLPLASFRLNSSTSCDRIRFDYEATLSCILSNSGAYNASVSFYGKGNSSSMVFVLRKTVIRSCIFSISDIIPIHPGLCFLHVTVPTFPGVFSRTFNVSVINDDPFAFDVSGRIATLLEEGDIIWSMNTSVSRCLSLTLYDKYGNLVLQCQHDFDLTAENVNSSGTSKYNLFGPTRGTSDCKGGLQWCNTRVTSNGIVRINVSSPYFNKIVSSINVSGQGAVAKLAVLTPQSQILSTVVAGSPMSSIQIQVTNAVGIALKRTENLAVKIRVVSLNSTGTRYSHCLDVVLNLLKVFFLQGTLAFVVGRK
jgi:hypothetical protein